MSQYNSALKLPHRSSSSPHPGRHWTPIPGQPVQLANEGRSHTSTTSASARLMAVARANPLYGGGLSITPDGGRIWTRARLPKTGAGWRCVGARSATALVSLADPRQPCCGPATPPAGPGRPTRSGNPDTPTDLGGHWRVSRSLSTGTSSSTSPTDGTHRIGPKPLASDAAHNPSRTG